MHSLFDFATPAPLARPAPAKLASFAGVVSLLAHARDAGLKFPKLWLQIDPERPLRIHVAGDQSKTPGWLQLTDGGPYGANRWYGRVSPDGDLELGRAGRDCEAQLVPLLEALAAEPERIAAEYGHLTGHCCFCHRSLSDDRSIAVGYGPVCAEKFGLSWG